ncbi:glycerophosphodiester phosphodiesterase, partial [Sarracenia purpurea var. burkii]
MPAWVAIGRTYEIKEDTFNLTLKTGCDHLEVLQMPKMIFLTKSIGSAPLVIARGGFSGLFADSSPVAYQLAGLVSLPNVIYWCDVQLTKDGAGICFPDLTLENGSDIATVFKNKKNTYSVNGVSTQGWFSVDFTLNDLSNISLIQGVNSRPDRFDGNLFPVLTVQAVAKQLSPPGLWLNIQHDAFFSQHNLSMRSFLLSVFRSTRVNYISSPEVNFLRSILARKPSTTKLIFRFLGQDEVEPSINRTYGSLLSNLTFIKTFASGILVPKTYIWPVDVNLYLQPYTSVVLDAHKEGLEVFASDFANDFLFAYNFSYNPVAEYLSFIDNGIFSVDGILSDFPITPSEAIACFSHIGKNVSGQGMLLPHDRFGSSCFTCGFLHRQHEKPLVISSQGSSGDYPGCTDLAYQHAISDGVDVLDCPVQMTKDGIPVCLGSINLMDNTLVAQSVFSNLTRPVSELGVVSGIFTFDLTWSEIQTLIPAISNPYAAEYILFRNPDFKNAGKFVTLSEFLNLANNASSVSGLLISIEFSGAVSVDHCSLFSLLVFVAVSISGAVNVNIWCGERGRSHFFRDFLLE